MARTHFMLQMVVFQRPQHETTDSCEIPIGKDKSITVPSELNGLLDAPIITDRPSPKPILYSLSGLTLTEI